MKTSVIIPAAGGSVRMGTPKLLIPLGGIPVLARTISAFENHEGIDKIIVVTTEEAAEIIAPFGFKKVKILLNGGETRQSTVQAGLADVNTEAVLVHDGARPLVTHRAISDVLAYVHRGECAVSGVKPKDTMKFTKESNKVEGTLDRDQVWIVQTPQGFPVNVLNEAHERALADGFVGTDDAILVERMGIPVYMALGDYCNIKLTTPEDISAAEAMIHNEYITR